ncbi:ThiF family adenylyltransferase [Mesorhizobium sp. M0644]|uniref:ThiF family adenylyltransferase n=1 Tax=Mesorhizobium sp. M0644 TaxID=2956979 RepID=UPI003336474B
MVDPGSSMTTPAQPVPRWERRYPGRLKYELDALHAAGITPEIDEPALAAGRLSLTFDWPLDTATPVRLQAVFPDAYPHFRPQVFLLAGLDPPPARHRSPIEGNLCLLGRDTRQWTPGWSLCTLLEKQLADSVRGTGEEDQQGEPAEYWWNNLGRNSGSYCLIDSGWDVGDTSQGTLQLRYIQDQTVKVEAENGPIHIPAVRAYVEEVRAEDGQVLHQWAGPLPTDLADAKNQLEVPWVRSKDTMLPEPQLDAQLKRLRQDYSWLQRTRPRKYGSGLKFELRALVYPSELAFGETGLGWCFVMVFGHAHSFEPKKNKAHKSLRITALPVFRAGPGDIGWRVPAVAFLKDKRILVVGVGAVGAPVAIELARNGCRTLDLVEHDILEPGNTIRWPLGAAAWGQRKTDALQAFLARQYPATEVRSHSHFIGIAAQALSDPGDDDILDSLIRDADLVIDGSASHGVTTLLDDRCRSAAVPLISMSATPTLEGGTVVRHVRESGCPNCLLHAWHKHEIEPPPGQDAGDEALTQPAGCSERTFTGADYDLQELSLQAVRLAIDTLSGKADKDSVVQTLSFVDDERARCPPRWRVDPLPKHPDCRGGH